MSDLPKELREAAQGLPDGFVFAEREGRHQQLFTKFERHVFEWFIENGVTPNEAEFLSFHYWLCLLTQIDNKVMTTTRLATVGEFVKAYQTAESAGVFDERPHNDR